MSAMNTHSTAKNSVLPILRWQLRNNSRGLIGWSLGLIFTLLMYLPLYPSFQNLELSSMLESMPAEMSAALGFDKTSTGSGYTQSTYFGMLGFLLAAVACIGWGSRAIAGAEESGRLELTLSHAIGRGQYALESLLVLMVQVFVLSLSTVVVVLLLNGPSELSLTVGHVIMTTAAWAALVFLTGCAALAVGAMTGRPSWALGAGAAVAIGGYVLDAISKASSSLTWLSNISPYSWAFRDEPLSTGEGWGGIAALIGLSLVLFGIGYWVFCRRDIHG